MVIVRVLENCAHCGKDLETVFTVDDATDLMLNHRFPYRGGSCARCLVLFVNPLRAQSGLEPLPLPELTDRLEVKTMDWRKP